MFKNYVEVKAALDRAKHEGFEIVHCYDSIRLKKSGKEFEPVHTAREIHCYLNGLADGAKS